MNRSHLSLDTFDPAPLALGERTTRLVEPVNPRAAFEAFERGDHFGPAHASTVNINGVPVNIGFDVKEFQRRVEQMIREGFGSSFKTIAASLPATYDDTLDAAIRHQTRFGVKATRALLTRKFGTYWLVDLQRRQYAEAIAALNGPEPDQGDGEGDTPDIAQ